MLIQFRTNKHTKYPAYSLSPIIELKLYKAPPYPAVSLPSSIDVNKVPEKNIKLNIAMTKRQRQRKRLMLF